MGWAKRDRNVEARVWYTSYGTVRGLVTVALGYYGIETTWEAEGVSLMRMKRNAEKAMEGAFEKAWGQWEANNQGMAT